jgi:hypothetical protein
MASMLSRARAIEYLPTTAHRAHPITLVEILITAAAITLLSCAGCATAPQTRSYRAAVFRSARAQRTARPAHVAGSVAFVERSLHDAGLRFGTDGSMGALYAYVRHSHGLVPPAQALPGDVVFFDTSDGGRAGCASHAGVVEAVDPDGRITFVESRDGHVRRSYVHPGVTLTRRDASGRVLNTYLRVKRIDDSPDARYFAGEMLCAVGRVR